MVPPPPAMLPFYDLCVFLDTISGAPQGKKARQLQSFRQQCIRPGQCSHADGFNCF